MQLVMRVEVYYSIDEGTTTGLGTSPRIHYGLMNTSNIDSLKIPLVEYRD